MQKRFDSVWKRFFFLLLLSERNPLELLSSSRGKHKLTLLAALSFDFDIVELRIVSASDGNLGGRTSIHIIHRSEKRKSDENEKKTTKLVLIPCCRNAAAYNNRTGRKLYGMSKWWCPCSAYDAKLSDFALSFGHTKAQK